MVKQNQQYLALLRGINVGGNNIIKMVDLKACFEALGFTNVLTYIQSGNIIFKSKKQDTELLSKTIEKALAKRFHYTPCVVVLSKSALERVILKAPKGFGTKPDTFRYNVLFLKPPLSSKEAIAQIKTNKEVDTIDAGKEVLYFSILISKASKSRISKIVLLPLYSNITIRNWNTTTKLLALMEQK